MRRDHGKPTPVSTLLLIFFSCFACVYVAGRLWTTTRELHYLKDEVKTYKQARRSARALGFPYLDSPPSGGGSKLFTQQAAAGAGDRAPEPKDDTLFYNIRRSAGGPVAPLMGPSLQEDSLPIAELLDDSLLGQVDMVENGEVMGWACKRSSPEAAPLQLQVYVDGVRIGVVPAVNATPHHMIHRLCELDMDIAGTSKLSRGVGFRFALPPLPPGKHELRVFLQYPDGSAKQEVNQSPLTFVESSAEPGLEEALGRKDDIIRVRNAQISALWDELHTRQPWRNAVRGDGTIDFGAAAQAENQTRPLVVVGINTGLGARARRDILRKTWVPTGEALKQLETEKGIVIRFVVGYSEQKEDPDEVRLQDEMRQYGDIIRLDMVDTYADLPLKTLKMFSVIPSKIDADFYFKVDDDVAMNMDALHEYLTAHRSQGNLYMGCMKSGQVLTDKRYKWFEPENWRFGDPAGADGNINYMRHASGQIYGLSAPVARYIGRNAPILHKFANEDVTLGAWLVGLEIDYQDERRLCCDSAEKCAAQSGQHNLCIGYYEHQCAGICSSEERLEAIYNACLKDPLHQADPAHLDKEAEAGAIAAWADDTATLQQA